MNAITAKIQRIGERMVACSDNCAGVRRDQNAGCLPRCLILETEDRLDGKGAAVVGINPGKATAAEEAYYRDSGATYDAVVQWFRSKKQKKAKYYVELRRLLKALEITGPILWTELAKCQWAAGEPEVPIQALRHCSMTYLSKELRCIPEDWVLIGVGRESFTALAYLYPDRRVLGVPHPTGSRGHFSWLFAPNDQLQENIRPTAFEVIGCNEPIACWLSADRLGRPEDGSIRKA